MNIVLVVGERPEQAAALAERLGILGVEALPCATDWKLIARSLTSHKFSLVIIDVNASEGSKALFRLVHDITEIPLVARGVSSDPDEVIWYLDHGAVDYVSRTMTPAVLAAKVQSALRNREEPSQQPMFLQLGDLVVDVDRHVVQKRGAPISLTPLEFRLLAVLAQNVGRACSHGYLLETVWGEDFTNCSHYLRLYMGYLRQKLEDDPRRPQVLLTEWGYGYRLVTPEPRPERTSRRSAVRYAMQG